MLRSEITNVQCGEDGRSVGKKSESRNVRWTLIFESSLRVECKQTLSKFPSFMLWRWLYDLNCFDVSLMGLVYPSMDRWFRSVVSTKRIYHDKIENGK